MRTGPPQLLPIFRSAGQARLLTRVYLGASAPATLAELARELDLDDGGLPREANRLERAGLVTSERVGSASLRGRVDELAHLELHVFGHVHEGRGQETRAGCLFANVTLLDAAYQPYPLSVPVFEL